MSQAREDAEAARALEARFEAKLARGGQVDAARAEVLAQLQRVRRELARQEALIRVGSRVKRHNDADGRWSSGVGEHPRTGEFNIFGTGGQHVGA